MGRFDLADESTTMSIEGTAENRNFTRNYNSNGPIHSILDARISPVDDSRIPRGFITAMVVIFSRSTNPVLICLYAVFEGMALGGLTWFYELAFLESESFQRS